MTTLGGEPTASSEPTPALVDDAEVAPEEMATVIYGGQSFQAAKTRRRGRETVRDMVISMAVVGLGIAALMLVTWRPKPEAQVRVVDWKPAAVAAQFASHYPVVTPVGLSDQWRATSARFEVEPQSAGKPVWHVGYVTPNNSYAGVEQSDADPAIFISRTVDGGRPDGEVVVGGRPWQSYGPGANGFRSLVRAEGGSTVIVTGSADSAELTALAAALQNAPAPSN